jgi:hypothetical protein
MAAAGEVFLLVHSPLVGPLTWSPVADELSRRGMAAVVPDLAAAGDIAPPYWRQHAEAAARAAGNVPAGRPLVLVGHSGAGPLLPAVCQALGRPVAAYLFVDAGIPEDGESLLGPPDSGFARELRELYAAGGRFPNWGDADLLEIIPDPEMRRRLLAELRPQPFAFWEESLPVAPGWPDAPCGYLQFSPVYDAPAARARERG